MHPALVRIVVRGPAVPVPARALRALVALPLLAAGARAQSVAP
jgi:hypothetical protein